MKTLLMFLLLTQYLPCLLLNASAKQQKAKEQQNEDYSQTLQSCIENPFSHSSCTDLMDLEAKAQSFLLETKQIIIPDYPDAFNPSIIRWENGFLLSFRYRKPISLLTNPIMLVFLDENFEPISKPQELLIPFFNPFWVSKQQDARLIQIDEKLFVVYSNLKQGEIPREIRRVYITEVFFDGITFTAGTPEPLLHFEKETEMRWEKNWTPFEYRGEMFLIYSILPHQIFRPLFGLQACETLFSTEGDIQWEWGTPRGGTPALKVGEEYLSFFHSSKVMPTIHSNGKSISHYVMGAYTFSSSPPFQVTKMTAEPLIAKGFYSGPTYKTWKPLRVVFPCGFVFDEDYIWVVYGKQDFESWVVKIDRRQLLHSLVPIEYP